MGSNPPDSLVHGLTPLMMLVLELVGGLLQSSVHYLVFLSQEDRVEGVTDKLHLVSLGRILMRKYFILM